MNYVLVDTSVWVDMLRDGSSPETRLLIDLIGQGLVRTAGLIRAEILSGAASRREFGRLQDYFSAFDPLDDPPDLWPRVADLRFRLARKGHQASVADSIIAVIAQYHNASIFTRDASFRHMQKALPLKLIQAHH